MKNPQITAVKRFVGLTQKRFFSRRFQFFFAGMFCLVPAFFRCCKNAKYHFFIFWSIVKFATWQMEQHDF
jgi:hypothetical protein